MPTESATGVTVESVRGMLAGIPSLTFLRSGPHAGLFVVQDDIILEQILSAESVVSTAVDVLLGIHEVRCQQAPERGDEPAGVIIKHALTKPRNWFEGDRWGDIGLPLLPVKEVLSVRVYPSGWTQASFDVPLSQIRLSNTHFQIASNALGVGGITGWAWNNQSRSAPLALMASNDGRAMPGGIEVTYRAGLSRREMDEFPLLRTLVRLQAMILMLTFYQAFLGGGAQKEAAGVDGMTNAVELARRDVLGPLGGEIKAMTASYNALLSVARMKFGSNLVVKHL